MIELEQEIEKVILVGVAQSGSSQDMLTDINESMDELAELCKTAGAVPIGRVIQNREAPHAGTYIGKGKIEEVRALLEETGAHGIITDDELSPAQMKNLEDALDTKVCDRTLLILDIFAKHASTREGKLQVELAQLRYRSTRLTGFGASMSRLGGGIGTRGPGEKKLEVDKRLIRNRISQLRAELEDVKTNREVLRAGRQKSNVPVVAIVGYTNAGKSTLLNYLTDAGVLSENKLFATLDPTTRSCRLESGQELLLTDTVGFIRKLPHHLVEAFRSTLEEARYADIILHVVDSSSDTAYVQMQVVYDTLAKLKVGEKPIVTAFNKQDLPQAQGMKDLKADKTVRISAATGMGVDTLLAQLEEILREQKVYLELVVPYDQAGQIALIRRVGELLTEEYRGDGIFVQAYVPKEHAGKFTQ